MSSEVPNLWSLTHYGLRLQNHEHRRKLSESLKGRKLSEETRRKMSEAMQSPERMIAREFFFSLSSDMPLTEKRKRLRQRFPDKHHSTICRWCKKFDSETPENP